MDSGSLEIWTVQSWWHHFLESVTPPILYPIQGEVRYGKNGHHIVTLMHVDKTLPLWAFFDVYGSTQKIKSLGK